MNMERIYQIILAPHVSEKTTTAAEKNRQMVFKVREDATKPEIRTAVEKLFEVEVDTVQVINVRGKMKYGKQTGKRANWKKAYVRLKPGHDIDFMGAQ
ncbi:MAG: 50S ribosomal protein L23 [Acidiferrobacteraceae bacterium]|jgi:large subunit ribosomal protein L23